MFIVLIFFFFQAEDGIRNRSPFRGLGDVDKRQALTTRVSNLVAWQLTDSACRAGKGVGSAKGGVLTGLPREIQRV